MCRGRGRRAPLFLIRRHTCATPQRCSVDLDRTVDDVYEGPRREEPDGACHEEEEQRCEHHVGEVEEDGDEEADGEDDGEDDEAMPELEESADGGEGSKMEEVD